MLAGIYKNKRIWGLLRVILLAGILFHSVTLFVLNKFYPLSGVNHSVELLEWRIFYRILAEKICKGCSGIFILGSILLACLIIKNGTQRDMYRWFGYTVLTVLLMFVCMVPFAIADPFFGGDYLFPAWGDIVVLIVLFILMSVIYFIKNFRLRKEM